ncbi:MAG: DUF4397 domain-containing protein [Pseudomonadaceae bacterium]|nr:DUF4397 domain-containing protein [Pseudomonadaceae bacterium]
MRKAFLLISMAAVFIAGCGGSSSNSSTPPGPTFPAGEVVFEIVHASQDAPPVNLSVGGNVVASGADFGDAAFVTTEDGEVTIVVEGIIPGGNTDVITATDTFADGQRVTVFAANDVANIGPIVLVDDQPEVAATDVRLRVVHAASNVTPIADMVDIYVTAPADPISSAAPITLMFGDFTPDAVTVPAGDYRIRITPAASSTVVYDSGTVALAGGSDLVVAAIANVGPGESPVELIALTGSASLRLLDSETPADVRVAHLAADVGPVDVLIDDVLSPVQGAAFGAITGYLPLAAGPTNFKVTVAGNASAVAIETLDEVALEAGETYTVAAVGLAGDGSLTYDVAVDNPRRIATESRVRIFHSSPAAGDVDIYVVGTGDPIDGLTPDFAAVPFGAETGYVPLAPGGYDVHVTEAGDQTMPVLPVVAVTLDAGGIYTAIAVDAAGGGEPVGLVLADDFL